MVGGGGWWWDGGWRQLWPVANGWSVISCLSVDLAFIQKKPSNHKNGKAGSNSVTLARRKNSFSNEEMGQCLAEAHHSLVIISLSFWLSFGTPGGI